MKLLPGIDLNELDYNLTKPQAITIALIAYLSIAAYIFLLAFECHNVYFYLYKQKKYKVYPVTLFYAFAIPRFGKMQRVLKAARLGEKP